MPLPFLFPFTYSFLNVRVSAVAPRLNEGQEVGFGDVSGQCGSVDGQHGRSEAVISAGYLTILHCYSSPHTEGRLAAQFNANNNNINNTIIIKCHNAVRRLQRRWCNR